MKVITLTNEKGGVAKTTLALHLAAGLAIGGARVLLIDADAQAHCGQQLDVPEFGGLYRLIVQAAEWKDVLREPGVESWGENKKAKGRLLLLPSNHETSVIPLATSNIAALRQRLEEMRDVVDVVIVDTSPTPSLLHAMLYLATDWAIYPTKCEALSLKGLADSTRHMSEIDNTRKAYGLAAVKLMGVQPTMYQDTNAHMYGLDLITEHFGQRAIWKPLAHRTIWRDREFAKKTLFAYAPTHPATDEMWMAVLKVAKHVG